MHAKYLQLLIILLNFSGPRQLLNAVTHYLDLSNLYGYTYQDAMKVRRGEKGIRTENITRQR